MNIPSVLKNFIFPPAEFSPVPFWFWNDRLTEDEIEKQILDFKAHGIDAFVIHPRIGLPKTLKYLSDEFMRYVYFAVQTAKKNNMKVVLYDEGMYPSGSANGMVVKNNPEFLNKCLVQKLCKAEKTVSAPSLADDERLIVSLALKTENDVLKKAVIIKDGEKFREDDLSKWQFAHYIMKPSGSTIRGIHFGEDDMEPDAPKAADLMNIKATEKFIVCTHERYYKALKEFFGNTVIAIFTDEPSPEARFAEKNSVPWTDDFLSYFTEALSVGQLPVLWLKNSENYNEVYKKYRTVVNRLMGERFFSPISKWCKDHGVALTGHPGKSTDIGHMKYFGMPCQDVVWRYIEPGNVSALTGDHSTMGKCTSSAAAHLGLRRNGNEVFGCCGPKENGWLMNYSDVLWYINWLFARGVNLIYPHAFFYSVKAPRFEERPPDVGPNSYWWGNFYNLSMYIKRMCYMLTDSATVCDTAFLCGPYELPYEYPRVFFENQYEFNYLEKKLLEEKTEIKNGRLIIQNQSYKNIIIEDKSLISGKTADILLEFVKNGGKVFTAFENDEFIYLKSPESILPYLESDFSFYPRNKNLRASTVIKEGKKFVILINEGEERIVGEINIKNAAELDLLNPMTGEIKPLTEHFIGLDPRESAIIYVKNEYEHIPLNEWYVNSEKVALSNWLLWKSYENYCGTVEYKTSFNLDNFSKVIVSFKNAGEILSLSVNGSKEKTGVLFPFETDITKYVKKGENIMTAKVTNSTAVRFTSARPKSGLMGKVTLKIEKQEKS